MKKESDVIALHIDFDKYTDGDLDFQRELVSLIVTDIIELNHCVVHAVRSNAMDALNKGYHKAKTTLEMINDQELTILMDELKEKMTKAAVNQISVSEDEIRPLSKLFNELATSIGHLND
jgi:hypothetical protein